MTLLPDEDSWSSRAKQFLRRDSFLRRARAKKAASPAMGGQADKDGPSEQPALLSEGRLDSVETDDTLTGASPRSLDGREFSIEPEEAALRRQESSAGAQAGPSGQRPNGLAAGEHSEDEHPSQSRASRGECSGRAPVGESARIGAEDEQPSSQQVAESVASPKRPRLPPLLWGPSSDQPSGQPPPPASPGRPGAGRRGGRAWDVSAVGRAQLHGKRERLCVEHGGRRGSQDAAAWLVARPGRHLLDAVPPGAQPASPRLLPHPCEPLNGFPHATSFCSMHIGLRKPTRVLCCS